ncbi:hypothetical protein SUGI_0047380 [Cryptomeria japonica]|nr:hypothetical protein SUGI_0047380 [Cryptomeria japonica]
MHNHLIGNYLSKEHQMEEWCLVHSTHDLTKEIVWYDLRYLQELPVDNLARELCCLSDEIQKLHRNI